MSRKKEHKTCFLRMIWIGTHATDYSQVFSSFTIHFSPLLRYHPRGCIFTKRDRFVSVPVIYYLYFYNLNLICTGSFNDCPPLDFTFFVIVRK